MQLRDYQNSIIEYGDEGNIIIDESKLDIFRHTEIEIPDWQPREIPPLESKTWLAVDIETTGLGNANSKGYINADFDPQGCVIKMIGIKSSEGKYKLLAGNDEKAILEAFVRILMLKKPDFLYTFNGYNFDLPFIMSRLNFYKIYNPFYMGSNPSKMSAAQLFGKPAIFHQIYLNWGTKKTYIFDFYLAALAWDFVARKLISFSLKTIPVQLGLREEGDRVELSFKEMLKAYENEAWDTMIPYLRDDLDDTERLANFFMPAIYYQSQVIPVFNTQQLFIYGNATKINKFLVTSYNGLEPEADIKRRFVGGKTRANCGFYRNVVKIDVASLYPTIMLAYGISSRKDTKNILLAALNYLKTTRLWHKANAKDESKPADERKLSKQIESAYKVIINSKYGFLGATGTNFNDYESAAMVTAYGRKILNHMVNVSLEMGAIIANIDTDAVAIACPEGKDREFFETLRDSLPSWVEVEYEWNADVFVPSIIALDEFEKRYKLNSYHGINFLCKKFPGITESQQAIALTLHGDRRVSLELFYELSELLELEFLTSDGLRKNYIVFQKNGKVKTMGKYRKRDKSYLFKNFPIEFLKIYRDKGLAQAENYYNEVYDEILTGQYPIEKLAITRKIRKGEKKLVELGLGEEGDVITFYKATGDSEKLIDSNMPYSVNYYLEELKDLYKEIIDTLTIQERTIGGNLHARRELVTC